jgi:hypothetical protein
MRQKTLRSFFRTTHDVRLEKPRPGVSHGLAQNLAVHREASTHLQEYPPELTGRHLGGECVEHLHLEPDCVRISRSREAEPIRPLAFVADLAKAEHLPDSQRINQRKEER